MAAMAVFQIEIYGRGCHGAMPHEGSDSILAACSLVTALQSIVSRNVDPLQSAVVSTTQIHAGDSWNAISGKCVIRGTARWFDPSVGDLLQRRIEELSESIAQGFGCDARLEYTRRYPPTVNDAGSASRIRSVVRTTADRLELLDAPPSTASEDFAFMLQEVQGAYFWLGSATPDVAHGLHSPQYEFNDDLLPTGIALWVSIVRNVLSSKGTSA